MRYHRHREAGTGFMATAEPSDPLPFLEIGEVWAESSWSIDWHRNPGWELYFQPKGASSWEIESTRATVPEGGAYLIQREVRHRLRVFPSQGVHFYFIVFPDESIPQEVRSAGCWKAHFTIIERAQTLQLPLAGLVRESAMRERWQEAACRWYLAILCLHFVRLAEHLVGEAPIGRHPSSERALRLLEGRPEHPWRLRELARLSGCSPQHLCEVFQADFGETPMRALRRLRLEEAQRQLRQTEKSVTAIAHDLGFASSQHLAQSFRLACGQTPTRFRSGPAPAAAGAPGRAAGRGRGRTPRAVRAN